MPSCYVCEKHGRVVLDFAPMTNVPRRQLCPDCRTAVHLIRTSDRAERIAEYLREYE